MAMEKNEGYKITMDGLITSMKEIMPYMQDKKVFEVYVNPDHKIWTDSLGVGRAWTGKTIAPEQTQGIIYSVSALSNQLVKAERPVIDAEIPANKFFPKCRFEGNLPPVVPSPTINIRKHPETIFTLEDYVEQGTLTPFQYKVLISAIHNKQNIIAAGGTKSGKTTFLNAILAEISKLPDRVILIEDTPELQCSAEDCVQMRSTKSFSMEDCLKQVLRMTPDRIVVGEVRSGEALALLDAWSTGHGGGCSTVHSNSARDTLLRLENMTSRVSKTPQNATIAQAVNLIVYLKYTGNKRKVEEIIKIWGYDTAAKKYSVSTVVEPDETNKKKTGEKK